MAHEFRSTLIADVKLVSSQKIGDTRGFFSEIYRRSEFEAAGISADFVQENCSFSAQVGTVRGLHFQTPPFAQSKLIRVVKGRIFDVAVDLRRRSQSYGKFVAVELSAQNDLQLFVPIGFAHGFCTLEPDTEVVYKVNNYYSLENDRGLQWNDPDLNIPWPVSAQSAYLSNKDRTQPGFRYLPDVFD